MSSILKYFFSEKKEKYSNELLLKQMKDFSNQIEYKTNLLNIDSQFRNKIPKNILRLFRNM